MDGRSLGRKEEGKIPPGTAWRGALWETEIDGKTDRKTTPLFLQRKAAADHTGGYFSPLCVSIWISIRVSFLRPRARAR